MLDGLPANDEHPPPHVANLKGGRELPPRRVAQELPEAESIQHVQDHAAARANEARRVLGEPTQVRQESARARRL